MIFDGNTQQIQIKGDKVIIKNKNPLFFTEKIGENYAKRKN